MNENLQSVDHSALRVNQALIIGLLLAGFVANAAWLAAPVATVMALGAIRRRPGFGVAYTWLLKPRGWVRPDVLADNPEPHAFAQGLGAAVLGGAAAASALGAAWTGWALVWLVIALAALNLFAGFCAGCAVYYWLARLHLPGFVRLPPPGTLPGMRPRRSRNAT